MGKYILSTLPTSVMLTSGWPVKPKIRLHTGNPGATGENNKAVENTEKEVELQSLAEVEAGTKLERKNKAAGEWPEVKAKETYTWITLRTGEGMYIAIELTTPVPVEIGDTFRINIGKLVIGILKEN